MAGKDGELMVASSEALIIDPGRVELVAEEKGAVAEVTYKGLVAIADRACVRIDLKLEGQRLVHYVIPDTRDSELSVVYVMSRAVAGVVLKELRR